MPQPAETPTPCRLCGGQTHHWGRKLLLGRHDVAFELCDVCGSLQSEPPYWLDEAYSRHSTGLDTGACQRCFDLVQETAVLLDLLGFPKQAPAVDFGAGTGLYPRMMRDRGFNFYAQDRYVQPYYMDGFSVEAIVPGQFRLITAFEVVEHFPNPNQDLASLFGTGADLVIIATNPYTGQDETWPYFSPEFGQHIFFYSLKGLASIAAAYGYEVMMARHTFLYVKAAHAETLRASGLDLPATMARLQDGEAFEAHALRLLLEHQKAPYQHAALDNILLANRASHRE